MRSVCGMPRSGAAQVLHRTAAAAGAPPSAVAPLRRLPLAVRRVAGECGIGARGTCARFCATAPAAPSSASVVAGSPVPRGHSQGVTGAGSATATAAQDGDYCSLCDAHFTSWSAHSSDHAHVARAVVCRFFVMPERSESIMQHLERHIALDLREVDALALRKVQRRRTRLLAGMIHLVEEGVLRDSIPERMDKPSPTGAARGVTAAALNVHADRFMTNVLLGDAVMRREVLDRCARLMPTLMAHELHSVATYLTTPRQLARVFDELALLDLLAARPGAQPESATPTPSNGSGDATAQTAAADAASPRWSLTRENKSLIVCACLGELHRFHDRTRPVSVATKAAADAIVLHVLAGHSRENLIAELVHDALQRIVDEGTPVWRQYQEETKRRARAQAPQAATAAEQRGGVAGAAMGGTRMNLRYAPLAAQPTPSPAATEEMTVDEAASQHLFESYFPFRDVRASGSDTAAATLAQGEGAAAAAAAAAATLLEDAEYVPAAHRAAKHWEPLLLDMRQRVVAWNSLDMVPPSPPFTATHIKKRDKKAAD